MDGIDTKAVSEAGKDAELNGGLRPPQVFEISDSQGFFATVSLVWNSRRQILRFVAGGFIVGILVAFIIPPKYKSTTQLMPPDSGSSSGMALLSSFADRGLGSSSVGSGSAAGLGALGGVASDLLGLKSTGDLFIGVLQSRTVQDQLINRFDLRKEYRVKRYETARKELSKNTETSQDHKSGIITITVYDRDPKRAAEMAREYVAELNLLMAQVSTSSARREREFLEERLIVVKQELDSASKDLSQYSSKNATINVEDEGKAIVDAAATLQGQLIAAQSELKGLEQIYTSNNVRVRSLQARVAELERKLNEIGGTKGISTENGDPNAGTVGQDNQDFLYPSLRQLPILGVRYADLYRRMKIAETVFAILTQEYELARVEEAKEIPTAKVLDTANIAERRSTPPRTALTVVFTLSAFLAGVVWVVGMRRWDQLDTYSPVRLTVLEIAGDIRSSRFWRKSEDLFRRMRGRFPGTSLFQSSGKGRSPQE
jgi:uncharacterized protein involved in exopolysaccharide biosynthesis